MTILTAAQVAAISARAEAALAGPWKATDAVLPEIWAPGRYGLIAKTDGFAERPDEQDQANAAFIAAARTDIPALVASLTAAREDADALRKRCAELEAATDEARAAGFRAGLQHVRTVWFKHVAPSGGNLSAWLDAEIARYSAPPTARREAPMPDKDPVEIGARALETVCWDALRENEREKLREDVRQVFAALSAEGFAVVRRSANRAQWDVWQARLGFEPLTDEAWARIQAEGRSPKIWDAMLAAAERESGGLP